MSESCRKPKISVIVPIYNIENYVRKSVKSIIEQTYNNLEIILVDDGSTDDSGKLCDEFEHSDKRIKVIHKENGGIDSARKAGIREATGKYVGYVDGDDWIEPDMYEKLISYAVQYDVEAVESGVIDSWLDRENCRVSSIEEGCYKGRIFEEKVEPYILYTGNFYQHGIEPYLCNKLLLKDCLIKYQMRDDLTNIIYNDAMVSLPCIAELKSLYVTHDCYWHYRVRTDSMKRKRRRDEVGDLRKCYEEFYRRFRGTVLDTAEDKQIKYYSLYWLLCKAPEAFDDKNGERILIPFGGFRYSDRIVLYGAGAVGIQMAAYLRETIGNHFVAWADRSYRDLQRTLDVIAPEDIMRYEYDYVIISILRESAVQSAKKDLVALGVPESRIRWIEQKYIDDPDLLLHKVL